MLYKFKVAVRDFKLEIDVILSNEAVILAPFTVTDIHNLAIPD